MITPRTTTMFALLVSLAACGENTVAPRVEGVDGPNVQGNGAEAALTATDTIRFSMTINPYSPTYIPLGAGNSIAFPARSVCNPATTQYGNGQWDKPCTALTVPITVNVKAWLDKTGHPGIDFSPNIRFVPSALPSNWVQLTFADYAASLDPMFNILYCREVKDGAMHNCRDESDDDPTLLTRRNPVTGQVTRRVKHFSGYMVGAGDDGRGSGGEMNITAAHGSTFTVTPPAGPRYQAVKLKVRMPKASVSADIGPEGGKLRLAQTGLTIVVPPNAVSTRTHFSVSTLGNGMLGYNFEPHGTQFAVPLQLTQSLTLTDALLDFLSPIQLAYFASDSQIDSNAGTVSVTELLNISPDRTHAQVSVNVWHFSGYMLVSGRGSHF